MPLAKIHVVEGRYDEARIAKLIFDSANTELIDLLRESAPHGCVGTTSAVDGVDDQAWLTGRTVGGSATPVARSRATSASASRARRARSSAWARP